MPNVARIHQARVSRWPRLTFRQRQQRARRARRFAWDSEFARTGPRTSRPCQSLSASRQYQAIQISELRQEVEALRSDLSQMRNDMDDLWSNFR